jgi:hypothetical protein
MDAQTSVDSGLKLNLGCGFRKKSGYINVDVSRNCMPDLRLDLARDPWPWETNSAQEIVFEYSMEQMGTTPSDLEHVLRELFRVSAHGAKTFVAAFHPRHDQFFLNPVCTQRLSPDFFHLLSMGRNLDMISSGQHHDVLGMKWGVNFEVERFKYLISPVFQQDLESGVISEEEIRRRMTYENNICQAFEVDLVANKG